jgi:hypothetical protein
MVLSKDATVRKHLKPPEGLFQLYSRIPVLLELYIFPCRRIDRFRCLSTYFLEEVRLAVMRLLYLARAVLPTA